MVAYLAVLSEVANQLSGISPIELLVEKKWSTYWKKKEEEKRKRLLKKFVG